MNLDHYTSSVRLHGIAKTAFHASYRAVNRLTPFAMWKGVALAPGDLDPKLSAGDPAGAARYLRPGELRNHVADADTPLTHTFLDEAELKGDRCVGFFEHGHLISYCWYSTHTTRLAEFDPSLVLEFDPSWVYVYNGFTAPRARGRGLLAYGIAHASKRYAAEGYKGLVAYIAASNFSSLRSSRRLGCRDAGYLFVVKVGERCLCSRTPGCEAYGLRVVSAESTQEREMVYAAA